MVTPIRLEAQISPEQFKISQSSSAAGALRLEPGQLLTGRVIKGGEAGATRMLWAGHAFDLTLPSALPVGAQIQMKVLSTEGAIQLQYISQAQVGALAAQLGQSGEPNLRLSPVAQWVAGLMQSVAVDQLGDSVSSSSSSLSLQSLTALRPQEAQPSVSSLIAQLQATIEKSGLFYESHQALWVQGRQTLESLLLEPQAQFGRSFTPTESSNVLNTKMMQGVPPVLIPHIERQLSVLEQQSVHWQGQIWPGVSMAWSLMPMDAESLEDEILQKQAAADTEQRPWYTRFNIELPTLGTVRAHFQVYRDYVNWRVEAENPDTQRLLKTFESHWLSALQSRGVTAVGEIADWEDSVPDA